MYATLIGNFAGRIRREVLAGRSYIVAPVTMIREGVLNGSEGPMFYPASEIARRPTAWDHVPLTLGHPTDEDGGALSARDPRAVIIGSVRGAEIVNGALKAEAWFDEAKTRRVEPRIIKALEAGKPVELSTGLFVDKIPIAGVYKGRAYQAVAHNYRPDHLAILPDSIGACSVRDGCGVLANDELFDINWKSLKRYLERDLRRSGIVPPTLAAASSSGRAQPVARASGLVYNYGEPKAYNAMEEDEDPDDLRMVTPSIDWSGNGKVKPPCDCGGHRVANENLPFEDQDHDMATPPLFPQR